MVKVQKAKGGGWDIVEVATGKIKGHSDTKQKAEISASYRNKAYKKTLSKKHG